MDYRCPVRTLLRTLGFAAGLSVCVTTAMANDGATPGGANNSNRAAPVGSGEGRINPNEAIIYSGGELDGGFNGTRADLCTQGASNCYDRPPGSAPYAGFISGQFNLQRFLHADDFVGPTPAAAVTSICWRGWYAADVNCANPSVPAGDFTIKIFDDDGGGDLGLPLTLLQTYVDGTSMTVTQGGSGLPVGFGGPVETTFSATAFAPAFTPTAGSCYWVEFDFTIGPGQSCFLIQGTSYENVQGNRKFHRRDVSTGAPYNNTTRINLDLAMCIGFSGGVALPNSNGVGACANRVAPTNDLFAGALTIACGGFLDFDNSFATATELVIPPTGNLSFSCRKSTIDPTDYVAGDVWFKFTSTAASATVSLCGTNTLGGLAGGDSLLSVFRPTAGTSSATIAGLTQIACSDDSCGTLSEVCVVGLVLTTTTYYVRVASFTPIHQGKYTISLYCPCPCAANDLCADAIDIPANPGGTGYDAALGILLTGQTLTAMEESNVVSCTGAAITCRGVWYKLTVPAGVLPTANGHRIRLSTDQFVAGTLYNTKLSVYCSADNTCNNLVCVGANDNVDILGVNTKSEVRFCAQNGKTYYILVHGSGTGTGVFGLLAVAERGAGNMLINCCDPAPCKIGVGNCTFVIPSGALLESALPSRSTFTTGAGGVSTSYNPSEPCNSANSASTNLNNGCGFTTVPRRYAGLPVGQAVTGTAWSFGGARDNDYWVNAGLTSPSILDWSYQGEFPAQSFPSALEWNMVTCAFFGGFVANTPVTCGGGFNRRTILRRQITGTPPTGTSFQAVDESTADVANGTLHSFNILVRNVQAGIAGYPCGSLNRYWLRLNFIQPISGCTAIADPTGAFSDEATVGTFNGLGGLDGNVNGEPCSDVNIGLKGGCDLSPISSIVDGDFCALNLCTPMVGRISAIASIKTGGANRDLDYFKFVLGVRSVVTLSIDSAFAMLANITNNDCDVTAIGYLTAATLGDCGARRLRAEDIGVLAPGTYILAVGSQDAFGGGAVFHPMLCAEPTSKYVLRCCATPLPGCTPVCPGGAIVEAETCLNHTIGLQADLCNLTNDGCGQSLFAAGAINSNPNGVFGTLFTSYQPYPDTTYPFQDDVFQVDQDYYQFVVTTRSKLTYCASANGPVRVRVAETGTNGSLCGDGITTFLRVLGEIDATSCAAGAPVPGVLYLQPGTYSLILDPGSVKAGLAFNDLPCPNVLSYWAKIQLEDLGRCCPCCIVATQIECAALGGTWTNQGSCGVAYSTTGFGSGSAYSPLGGAAVSPKLGDEEVRIFAIPPFIFPHEPCVGYTQMGVSSNGFIEFGGSGNSAIPRKFPNTALPNNVVGPFWNDWNMSAPTADVYVFVDSTGGLGNEITTVEWRNAGAFADFSQRATFQVVLRHATGNIEFRYGTFTNLAGVDLTKVAVGCESATGLDGIDQALTASFLTGNNNILYTKNPTSCTPVCCQGNADKVAPGFVNFSDLTAVFTCYGANYLPLPGTGCGDANCDGVVNFADATAVFTHWLEFCP